MSLPQKYSEIPKALIPYVPAASERVALITIDPALPCFICSQPATYALIVPAAEHLPSAPAAWLTFPICTSCEERQIQGQAEG